MRSSLSSLGAESPLNLNLEAVLPGLHNRLGSLESTVSAGFSDLKKWQHGVDDMVRQNGSMVRANQQNASELVSLASRLLLRDGEMGAGGGAGQASSSAPRFNSQQQAAAANDKNDDDDDDHNAANFELAKRHKLMPRHCSLYTVFYEWYGLESSKDQPIVGGFKKCEQLFKSSWRKGHSPAQKKHFSRLKKIIEGLQRKAANDGLAMEEVVEVLAATFSKYCKNSLSKMVDWMMTQRLIPPAKTRATST
jgi:hypothetical protein